MVDAAGRATAADNLMLTSLLFEARLRTQVWRRRLTHYRHAGDRRDLAFLAMLGLPVLGLGAILYFSYSSGVRVEPARLLAEQRAEKRALRREAIWSVSPRTSISKLAVSLWTGSTPSPKSH